MPSLRELTVFIQETPICRLLQLWLWSSEVAAAAVGASTHTRHPGPSLWEVVGIFPAAPGNMLLPCCLQL